MKHVLIFSLFYCPNRIGGAEIAIKEITNRIKEDDYRFSMVALRTSKSETKVEKIGNVLVYRIGYVPDLAPEFFIKINKYLFPFLSFFQSNKINKIDKVDMIWSMMASYNAFGSLFFKLKNRSVPFLLTLQEGDPIPYIKRRAAMVWPVFESIFKKADHIQVISNYLGDFAKEMNPNASVTLVANGVDLGIFKPGIDEVERYNLRNQLGFIKNDKVLITTSRLVYKNGIDTVIKALKSLPQEYKFLIVGAGPLLVEFRKLVDDLSLNNRVKFLGYIEYKELPNYLKASDFFIRPSRSEGFGNSFIEAMAVKIPVLATNVGGIADFLFDKKTGFVVEADNPDSIINQIQYIENNPQRVLDVIDEAYQMVLNKYNWDTIASMMIECFKKADFVLKSK